MHLTPIRLRMLVDYGLSWKERLAAGRYTHVDPQIVPKYFPIKGEGMQRVEFRVFRHESPVHTENVVAYLHEHGFAPAGLVEQLAFGEIYKAEGSFLALGSMLVDPLYRLVPVLRNVGGHSSVELVSNFLAWFPEYWFLAVRRGERE